MIGLEAEVDLASIDKVDVRNELRRFTLLWVLDATIQKLGPYLNLCISAKMRPTVSFCHAPVKPRKTRPFWVSFLLYIIYPSVCASLVLWCHETY